MLRVLGSRRTLCSGLTRRELLEVGGSSVAAVSLPALLAAESTGTRAPGDRFGCAKNCILIYLYGAPSQLETFDMKPHAPAEIRGTMRPIASSLPGLDVCEHLPHTARVMDRTTVIRSLTHPHPIHGIAYATTGIAAIDVPMELNPRDPRHHPYFASAVEYVDRRDGRQPAGRMPANLAFPFPLSTQRTGEVHRAGPYAAFLGSEYNPVWTEFQGTATRTVRKTLGANELDCADPYLGSNPDAYFRLASSSLPDGLTLDRLNRRRTLLHQFDSARRDWDATQAGRLRTQFEDRAYALLSSEATLRALDVRHEPEAVRAKYGHTLFGQACLAARRSIEAGSRVVSVFWDEFGLAGDAWDTHWNHFPRMIDQLLPSFDMGYSGLISDMDERGLLDDTLVVVMSEHGRTPKINSAAGGGRDHWSRAYCGVLAGAGIARGRVVGATDAIASDVTSSPVGPKDLLATMYHLLGIEPHQFLPDRSGRPQPLLPDEARVVREALA